RPAVVPGGGGGQLLVVVKIPARRDVLLGVAGDSHLHHLPRSEQDAGGVPDLVDRRGRGAAGHDLDLQVWKGRGSFGRMWSNSISQAARICQTVGGNRPTPSPWTPMNRPHLTARAPRARRVFSRALTTQDGQAIIGNTPSGFTPTGIAHTNAPTAP